MPRTLSAETQADFVAESRSYLPRLRAAVEAVRRGLLSEDIAEAHRLAHCIRGTSALFELEKLTAPALHLEEMFEQVTLQRLPANDGTADQLRSTLELIVAGLDDLSGDRREEEVEPELLTVFAQEAEDHLRALRAALPALGERPDDRELMQQVRRRVHTLKGSAGMVGFRTLTQMAHRMEDLLDRLYEGERPLSSDALQLLAASLDVLDDLAAGHGRDASLHDLYQRYDGYLGAESTPAVGDRPVSPSADRPAVVVDSSEQFVRVPLARLDELTRLVSEMVLSRAALEQRLTAYRHEIDELRRSGERLHRATAQLEPIESPPGAILSSPLHVPHSALGFDELEFDRYSEVHLLGRELGETAADIDAVALAMAHLGGELESDLERQAQLASEIQDRLTRVRLVPLSTLESRLRRTVRSAADAAGKCVELVLEGETTELDKSVLQQLADPLLHLLRNATDHGIEPPEERLRLGKPEQGRICVRAGHDGGQIVLEISDDGAGIDSERVRTRAIEGGFVGANEAARFSEEQLYALLFRPGFSTARIVSEVSGRGVGLDVVRDCIGQLRGNVMVTSRLGAGTTFTLRLPMTLAILRALLVKANGQTFAVPLASVLQVSRLGGEDCEAAQTEGRVQLAGEEVPRLVLGDALGLPPLEEEAPPRPPVVLIGSGGRRAALMVDQLLGAREIVVKGLGDHIRRLHGIAGATLLGDGNVVLILNPGELMQPRSEGPRRLPVVPRIEPPQALTVLIVDDSPSVRRVMSNLVRGAGWTPVAARDGIEALERLHARALPDVMLLDIEMPRMDGFELLGAVRADPALKGLPVAIVTSRAGEKHRRRASELGADAHLVKPCQEDELLETVRRLARGR
jgi:chemosensory pili system protein ChpA (sensor histidine kinase/response regulator)